MRVQLQQGFVETHAVVRMGPENPGVTVFQMRDALRQLFEETPILAKWFPFNSLKSEFVTGVITLSQKLGTYPPAGVTAGGQIPGLRYEMYWRGKDYRIDIENLRGHNLRR
jgi:hypothetical protein